MERGRSSGPGYPSPGDARGQSHPAAACRNQAGTWLETSAPNWGTTGNESLVTGTGLGTRRDIFIQLRCRARGNESCGFIKFHANVEVFGASETGAGGF